MEVAAEGQHLHISGRQLDLGNPVAETLVVGDVVIARVDSDRKLGEGDRSLNRNVLAFDRHGEAKWVIQEAPHGEDEWPKPYTAIRLDGEDLTAYNWIGVEYKVDLESGRVTPKEGGGRPW